ncbi:hypothetical protein HYDPIDRAFT_41233 [Hydnomerulius pinastri MD-312]|uniref:Unplaced genomic scaffold scaffold_17, whole genome shotgun sequence n=1 Tax=Hydnomerulius pinastri MD-312 TaxID=994086 RepID=A0A0C9VCS7_9AGAM|nr:hypothetical protein HYDPIDRAFT_41233 [Hydnomerulius pinastri MD-312]
MLATKPLSPSFPQSLAQTASPCSNTRAVLADSTNTISRPGRRGVASAHPQILKRVACPVSSARINTAPSAVACLTGHTLTAYSRHYHSPGTPSPFPVAYKAPPTVSVSLSAACSQNIERALGARTLDLEPDLPDVKSVVPFPCSLLHGDEDVEMLDGTCLSPSSGSSFSVPQVPPLPRKRRSACSSISSSQNTPSRKDPKDGSHGGTIRKRARKSRRQVADLWWLGVVHRSITCGLEIRQSVEELHSPDGCLSEPCHFDALDRMLAGRIWKRLVEGGCVEGRAMPSPFPRISSPTMSVPSLGPSPVLAAPICLSTSPVSSAPTPGPGLRVDTAIVASTSSNEVISLDFPCPACPPPSPVSPPSLAPASPSSPDATPQKPHVRFQIPLHPPHPQLHPSMTLQRSPSPPPRTAPALLNAQTLTLSMPQLVASLTLAHRERSALRGRGRGWKGKVKPECQGGEKRSDSSCASPASQADCRESEGTVHTSIGSNARLLSAPQRKSPLSHVVDIGSCVPPSDFGLI